MFLRWLSRLLASFLVSLLFTSIFVLVLSQTILSPHYITQTLQKTNAYDKLTTAINKEVAQSNSTNLGIPASQLTSQLQNIITPKLLQQKLDTTIGQIKAYYDGNGPLPTLDLTDVASQLQTADVQLPSNVDFTKPIKLNQLSKLKQAHNQVNKSKIAGLGSMLLLALGLIAIAIRRKNYKPLANVFVSLGSLLGLTGGTLLLVPKITDHFITNSESSTFAGLARDIANKITHDIGIKLLVYGVISLVIGIAGRLLIRKLAQKAATPVDSEISAPKQAEPELVAADTPDVTPIEIPTSTIPVPPDIVDKPTVPKRPTLIQ